MRFGPKDPCSQCAPRDHLYRAAFGLSGRGATDSNTVFDYFRMLFASSFLLRKNWGMCFIVSVLFFFFIVHLRSCLDIIARNRMTRAVYLEKTAEYFVRRIGLSCAAKLTDIDIVQFFNCFPRRITIGDRQTITCVSIINRGTATI
jgi:hypothetical protein